MLYLIGLYNRYIAEKKYIIINFNLVNIINLTKIPSRQQLRIIEL